MYNKAKTLKLTLKNVEYLMKSYGLTEGEAYKFLLRFVDNSSELVGIIMNDVSEEAQYELISKFPHMIHRIEFAPSDRCILKAVELDHLALICIKSEYLSVEILCKLAAINEKAADAVTLRIIPHTNPDNKEINIPDADRVRITNIAMLSYFECEYIVQRCINILDRLSEDDKDINIFEQKHAKMLIDINPALLDIMPAHIDKTELLLRMADNMVTTLNIQSAEKGGDSK